MAVRAHHLALRNLPLDTLLRPVVDRPADVELLVVLVVELKDDWVFRATVHARVFEEVFVEPKPFLLPELPTPLRDSRSLLRCTG